MWQWEFPLLYFLTSLLKLAFVSMELFSSFLNTGSESVLMEEKWVCQQPCREPWAVSREPCRSNEVLHSLACAAEKVRGSPNLLLKGTLVDCIIGTLKNRHHCLEMAFILLNVHKRFRRERWPQKGECFQGVCKAVGAPPAGPAGCRGLWSSVSALRALHGASRPGSFKDLFRSDRCVGLRKVLQSFLY